MKEPVKEEQPPSNPEPPASEQVSMVVMVMQHCGKGYEKSKTEMFVEVFGSSQFF